MGSVRIEKVVGREILDSRGNPTVEATVYLSDGTSGWGCAPSGASTGEFEALELRDRDFRYCGNGVKKAVENINTIINDAIKGMNPCDIYAVDSAMIYADGTKDKSKLGANAVLAVSIATVRAAASSLGIPLYRFIGGVNSNIMPVPMMNILNGGAHVAKSGNGGLDTQEFMIMPVGASCEKEAVRMCAEVYHSLAKLMKADGLSTAVGDEGGFAPNIDSDETAIEYIIKAIKDAGYKVGREYGEQADFVIALDAAASEWKPSSAVMLEADRKITGQIIYKLPKSGNIYSTDELIAHWKKLVDKYPIVSIEDALDEEDWDGWQKITAELGNRIQLVGDDLFVTNTERLSRGISTHCGNSILIKLNQIGSVTETLDAIKMAHQAGYKAIVSHRSGETEDTMIADLAVALNCGQIKTGAPCRGERVAKYNRLLKIEEELGKAAVYAGMNTIDVNKD